MLCLFVQVYKPIAVMRSEHEQKQDYCI